MSRLAAWLMKCRHSKTAIRPRLNLVGLEDRVTPSTFTVSNLLNSGPGSLRQAILDANANGTGLDTIEFTTGGLVTLATEIPITGSVFIDGTGTFTVSGGNATRIFNIDNPTAAITVTIDSMVLTAGSTSGHGGAILNSNETLIIQGSTTISNSKANGNGGGIASSGSLSIVNSNVSGNKAGNNGGAIDGGGTIAITTSSITSNSAANSGGGLGIANASLGITNSKITGNSASNASALYSFNNTLTVVDSTISNNTTAGSGTFRIVGGSTTIERSLFVFNTANEGAAIRLGGSVSAANLRNLTITNNTATQFGGGLLLANITGTVNVHNSTITGNSSGTNGGGVAMYKATTNIESCVIAGNTSASGADFVNGFNLVSVKTSAFQNTTGVFTDQGGNIVGPVANLLLAPLAVNGGAVSTIAWGATSPLRNAGSNPAALTTDARGLPRASAAADIGAVELQDVVINTNDSGVGTLREAVMDANRFPGTNTIVFNSNFAVPQTIAITSGELAVNETLFIDGTTAIALTISGNNNSRVFNTEAGPSSTELTLQAMTLTGGKAADGGAINVGDEKLILEDVLISGCSAADDGGAINIQGVGSLVTQRSTFSGNTAGQSGGGIYFFDGGSAYLFNSSIVNNKANTGTGGGLYFFGTESGLALINCTVSGNSAASSGGGVVLHNFTSDFLVANSTIYNNTASIGGGIARTSGAGTITLESSIVSNNSAASGPDMFAGNVTANKCALATTAGYTFVGGNDNIYGQDLLLSGLTQTGTQFVHIPASNSPLKDAGSNLVPVTTDQRGLPRTLNAVPDIGAVEIHNPFVRNANDAGKDSLRQQILDANAIVGIDTISFDSAFFTAQKTIVLSGELKINDAVTINGPGARLVTVSGNNANRIFNTNGAPALAAITVNGLTVANGKTAGNGAAITIGDETVTLNDCAITGSTAGNLGGGIVAYFSPGSVTLNGCTLSGNSASASGGAVLANPGVNLTVRNSTFTANSASNNGGAIRFNTGTLLVQNSTIVGNSAANGGGIVTSTSFTLESSIVSGNTATSGPEIYGGINVNAKNSAIGSAAGFTFNDQGSNLAFGTNLKLRSLANNGGPTDTIAFEFDSPLRNVGSNPTGVTVDQRGFSRDNGGVDIGAFELNTLVTTTNNSGTGSLREAVDESNRVAGLDTITFNSTFNTSQTILLGSGALSLTDSVTITGSGANLTTVSAGGGSRLFDLAANKTATISGLTLTGGSTFSVGGAITAATGSTLNLQNAVVTGNSASGGGGISSNGTVNIDNCVISDNSVSGTSARGGAVFVTSGILTITNSTFTGNKGEFGGAINAQAGSTLAVINSTFSQNSASFGGGAIHLYNSFAAGNLLIRNSTFTNNTANVRGGAIRMDENFNGTLLVQNSTIVGNTATMTQGGGISRDGTNGTISLESTIVSGNSAPSAPDINSAGTVNVNFSAIGSASGFTPSGGSGNNLAFGTNLKLRTLANNGGPTPTIAFEFDSPIRDKGSNPAGLGADQRGFPRNNGGVDIGAFELNTLVTNTLDAGDGSLRAAIAESNRVLGTDTITFDSSFSTAKTITLSDQLALTEATTITGPGANLLTLSGNNSVRNFDTRAGAAGATFNFSKMTLTNGKSTDGGAVILGDETLNLNDIVLANNTALANGGAVHVAGNGTVNLTRASVSGNSAVNGGGVFINTNGQLTTLNSTLAGNSAGRNGGGVYFYSGGSLSVVGSTISGNKALHSPAGGLGGGGIYFYGTASKFEVINSTVSGNSAVRDGAGYGGGILLNSFNGPVVFRNSTITLNNAGSNGGGVAVTGGTLNWDSTVIAANTINGSKAAIADLFSLIPIAVTGGNNLVGIQDAATKLSFAGSTQTGTLAAPLDAKLAPLANNGGPTLTHLPAVDSPLVNAGSNPAALTTDARGLTRSVGAIDIGAVELQATNNVLGMIINDGAAQRSRVTKVQVFFATPVSIASLGTIAFNRVGGGSVAAGTGLVATAASGTASSVTLTFTTGASTEFGSLADGRWSISFPGSGYLSPQFHRLFGDVNGDATVDGGTDFAAFAIGNLTGTNAPFDFNGDGTIDGGTDFAQFGSRFGKTI